MMFELFTENSLPLEINNSEIKHKDMVRGKKIHQDFFTALHPARQTKCPLR